MKAMTKFLGMALALFLVATPLTAFAGDDTLTGTDESHEIDVVAKADDSTVTPDVYSMDVVWGAMAFTYSTAGTREWDPATHRYTDRVTSGWGANGNTVTVTNHSNTEVVVTFSYEGAVGFTGISGAFSVISDTLAAGVVGDVDGADSVSTTLTLSGVLASDITEFTKVGMITVSLG